MLNPILKNRLSELHQNLLSRNKSKPLLIFENVGCNSWEIPLKGTIHTLSIKSMCKKMERLFLYKNEKRVIH